MPIRRMSRFRTLEQFLRNDTACRLVLGLAALLTWAVGAAPAGSITANFNGASPGVIIGFTFQDVPGLTPPLTEQLTVAGEFNWSTVSGAPGLPNQFVTFCIELDQEISPGNQYTYNLVPPEDGSQPGIGTGGPGNNGPIGIAKADQISQLWGMHFPDIDNAVTAAAFQITIWEIVFGSSFTPMVYTGDPQSASDGAAAIALASTWLADVQTPEPQFYESNLVALTSPTAQDQVTVLAPAPAPLALAGIGLLGLLGFRRRIRG
jgi:hypothetical protein